MEFSLKIVVILFVFIIGCLPKAKWGVYYGKEGSYVKLKPDGSFYAKNIKYTYDSFEAEDSRRKGGGLKVIGKYKFEKSGTITFVLKRGRAIQGKIRGDTLSVGTANDQKFLFRK